MGRPFVFAIPLLCAPVVALAAPDETAVETFAPTDVDRSVDPCNDFYACAR